MKSIIRTLAVLSVLVTSATAAVVGAEHPLIRLTDGTVLRKVKVLGCTADNVVSIFHDNSLRTVPLENFPRPLQKQIAAEGAARRETDLRYNIYRRTIRPPPPPPDSSEISPAAIEPTNTIIDQFTDEAAKQAASELKLYLLKTYGRVSSLTTHIRKSEQVPGWQKIRVSGDAAFSYWDENVRTYVWRTEKFTVEFAIIDMRSLKLDTVSFGGISRQADSEGSL